MPRLLTDSWEQEQHYSLKRWERGAQRAAWSQRATESAAPPLPCPWRRYGDEPLALRPARVLALFASDLSVVRFLHTLETGAEAGVRVLRGGIPWDRWCPVILAAWRNAAPVPEPFRLRRRLPPQWLDEAVTWSPGDQTAFVAKLRASGLLSPLRPVSPEAVAPWLRWDEMRARLIDAREGGVDGGR
jgi:hypothetical protein